MRCSVREDKIRGISDELLECFWWVMTADGEDGRTEQESLRLSAGQKEAPRDNLCHNELMPSYPCPPC